MIVVAFLFRSKLFVTPKELSDMKEYILNTVKDEYATKELVQFIREDISEMKDQLKIISDFILTHRT